jgi:hypothetical protein
VFFTIKFDVNLILQILTDITMSNDTTKHQPRFPYLLFEVNVPE